MNMKDIVAMIFGGGAGANAVFKNPKSIEIEGLEKM